MERQVMVFDSKEGAAEIRRISGGKIPIMPDYDKDVPYDYLFKTIKADAPIEHIPVYVRSDGPDLLGLFGDLSE